MYQKDFSLKPSSEGITPSSNELKGIDATPEYEQQRKEYESLWQTSSASEKAPEAPPSASESSQKKAKLRERFRKLVGAETFIPEAKLHPIKNVGSGSFATVEICSMETDVPPQNLQQVAVKRLKPNTGIGISDLASEARILAKLKHRNIVEYIGVGYKEDDEMTGEDPAAGCYMVQEFINGGTLKQKLLARPSHGKRAYSYADAIRWCRDVADGLAYLHGVNPVVVHRDLKAENILLREGADGKSDALICDFGLAVSVLNPELQRRRSQLLTTKSMHHFFPSEPLAAKKSMKDIPKQLKEQKSAKLNHDLSKFQSDRKKSFVVGAGSAPPIKPPEALYDLTGGTGSYCYMAPEITLCKPYNEKVDCFSMGVIMWELFQHTTTSSIVLQTGDYDACALYAHKVAEGYRQEIPHKWPHDLCALIEECWKERAPERPRMTDILTRIDKVIASGVCEEWDEHSSSGMRGCRCF